MYARIHNVIAQSEMQLTMWQETFKAIGAKSNMRNGAKQITVTKIAPNKAVLITVFPNKEIADKAFQAVKNNVAEVSKLLKMEINEGEVVFNQNSLTHE
tara:strand:- start:535 stop:831 length:297 start_codon:yes stop_codon:yes gene_type:complete